MLFDQFVVRHKKPPRRLVLDFDATDIPVYSEQEQRVIGKAGYTRGGPNPRFITTNLEGDGEELYRKLYCARGDMENRTKDQQMDLFASSKRINCQQKSTVPVPLRPKV